MKVKDLILNLLKRNQESEVYISVETEDELLDIIEVTFGKNELGEEFTVVETSTEEISCMGCEHSDNEGEGFHYCTNSSSKHHGDCVEDLYVKCDEYEER